MASDFIPNPGVRVDGKLASPKAATRKNLSTDMKVGRKNVFDYTDSAISDGGTNAKTAIEAADTDGPVVLSPGTYAIASDTTLSKKPLIEPGAKLKPASGVTITLADGYVAEDTQHIFDLSAGGTVIIPTGQRFTVNHVGAIGDNSTDNLTIFQKAITIAKASSTELIIPSGTYLFSAELLTGSATGLTIRGTDPQRSKLKFTGTTTWGGSFTFAVCDKITIQDLFFEGTSDDVAGIYVFNGSTNVRVQNCTFANWGTGIAAPHGAVELEGVTGVVVTNCEVYGGLGNVNSDIRLTNCSDIVCEGNLLRSANADGITVSNTVTSESIFNLSANTIRGKYRHGILLGYGEHPFRGTVSGNSIYDCKTNGVYVQSGGDPAGELSIVGNSIVYCGGEQVGDGAGNAGIHLSGNLGGTVSGNTLVNCGYDPTNTVRGTGRGRGIILSFAENWTITGNTVVNSAKYGIGVNDSGTLKNTIISGNTIIDAVDSLIYLGEASTELREVYLLNNTLTCLNKDCHGIYFYETNGTSDITIKGNEITGLKSGTNKSAILWGVEKYKKVDISNNTFKNWDYAFSSTNSATNQNEDWAFGRCVYADFNTYDNVTVPFNIRKTYIHSAVGANNRFINTTPGYDSKLVPASFLNGRLEGYFVGNLPNKKCRVGDRLKPLNVTNGDDHEWFVRTSDQPAATGFTVTSGNVFNDTAHGLSQNSVIRFTSGSLPTPLVTGKDYFVTGIPNADTFTISEALNGATLTLTSTGSGNYQVQEFTPTWQSDIYDWLNRKQIVKHRWNGDGNNDTIGDPNDVMSGSNMLWYGTAAYATPPTGKGDGKAFQVNGSSSYLKATTDEYSDTEVFTVCGWVKLDTTTGTQNIVNVRDTTGGWQLSQDAGILYLQTASATLTSSYASELSVGTWAHIAIVFNGANSIVYVNGIQRAATFTADWVAPSTHFLELGAISSYTTQYLDGELFDWRLYERALTESQLLGLINGPSFGGYIPTAKLPGTHNPLDYTLSAISAGVIDARYAILQADVNGPVILQPGTYAIASNMTLTNNIKFEPGAKLKPASGITITLNGGYTAEHTQHVFDITASGTVVIRKTAKPSSAHWGTIGDYSYPNVGTDNSASFQAFFNAVNEMGLADGSVSKKRATAFVPPGSYRLNTPITVGANTDLEMSGVLLMYFGSRASSNAIFTIGADGSAIETGIFYTPMVQGSPTDFNMPLNEQDFIGIRIKNCGSSIFFCDSVTAVGIGYQLTCEGDSYLAHNIFINQKASVVKTGMEIYGTSPAGWVNENTFIGFNYTATSTENSYGTLRGIHIKAEAGGYNGQNNNRFYSPCFQPAGRPSGYDLIVGRSVVQHDRYFNLNNMQEYVCDVAGPVVTVPTNTNHGQTSPDASGVVFTHVGPYFRSPIHHDKAGSWTLVSGARHEYGDGPFAMITNASGASIRGNQYEIYTLAVPNDRAIPMIDEYSTSELNELCGNNNVLRVYGEVSDTVVTFNEIHKRFIGSATAMSFRGMVLFDYATNLLSNYVESTNYILCKSSLSIQPDRALGVVVDLTNCRAVQCANYNGGAYVNPFTWSNYAAPLDANNKFVSIADTYTLSAISNGSFSSGKWGIGGEAIFFARGNNNSIKHAFVGFSGGSNWAPTSCMEVSAIPGRSFHHAQLSIVTQDIGRTSYGTPTVGYFETFGEYITNLNQSAGQPKGWRVITTGILAPAWAGNTAVIEGELRKSGSNVYAALSAGTTGNPGTAPTGTSSSVSDGVINWEYIGTVALLEAEFPPEDSIINVIFNSDGTGTDWYPANTYISSMDLIGDFDITFNWVDRQQNAIAGVCTDTTPLAAGNYNMPEFGVYWINDTTVQVWKSGSSANHTIATWGNGFVRLIRSGTVLQLYINDTIVSGATEFSFSTATMRRFYSSIAATASEVTIYGDYETPLYQGSSLDSVIIELPSSDSTEILSFSATPVFRWLAFPQINKSITLTANVTGAVLLAKKPGNYYIIVVQDGAGSHTFTITTTVIGTAPTINSSAGASTMVGLRYTGSTWFYI